MLRLLTLLSDHPDGMRAADVAAALGKSPSTAYNLLDTLCQEGFASHAHGVYQLTAEASALADIEPDPHTPLRMREVVDELFERTHKRVYVAAARSGRVVAPLERGRQGIPRIPGLGPRIRENAHALAIGKVALSLLDERDLERYLRRGLQRFTPATIVSPEVLRTQLAAIREGVVAHDCEEMAEDFCCLAVPVRNPRGQAVAVVGLSMTRRCFEVEGDELSRLLVEVAERASGDVLPPPIPAISEETGVLDSHRDDGLVSAASAASSSAHRGEEATQ